MLHELDPVAERIGDVPAIVPGERLVFDDAEPSFFQAADQAAQIGDREGRVRLLGRAEVLLDAEMDLQRPALEPAAASPGQVCGLLRLRDAQEIGVKAARGLLVRAGIASCT